MGFHRCEKLILCQGKYMGEYSEVVIASKNKQIILNNPMVKNYSDSWFKITDRTNAISPETYTGQRN